MVLPSWATKEDIRTIMIDGENYLINPESGEMFDYMHFMKTGGRVSVKIILLPEVPSWCLDRYEPEPLWKQSLRETPEDLIFG